MLSECCLAASGTGNLGRAHGVMKKDDYVNIVKADVKKSAASLALGSREHVEVGPKPLDGCQNGGPGAAIP